MTPITAMALTPSSADQRVGAVASACGAGAGRLPVEPRVVLKPVSRPADITRRYSRDGIGRRQAARPEHAAPVQVTRTRAHDVGVWRVSPAQPWEQPRRERRERREWEVNAVAAADGDAVQHRRVSP